MTFTKAQLSDRVGVSVSTLELWLAEGWLRPDAQGLEDVALAEPDLARAYLIRDLVDRMGVNAEGVEIILGLLDQLHGLRTILQSVLRSAEKDGLHGPTRSPV